MKLLNSSKTKFINREEELKELVNAYSKILNNEGQVFFINGPAGIGKTRFINEFVTQIKEKDNQKTKHKKKRKKKTKDSFLFFQGFCQTKEDHTPYLPFKEIMNELIEIVGGDQKKKKKIEA